LDRAACNETLGRCGSLTIRFDPDMAGAAILVAVRNGFTAVGIPVTKVVE